MKNKSFTKILSSIFLGCSAILVGLLMFKGNAFNTVKATSAGIEQENPQEQQQEGVSEEIPEQQEEFQEEISEDTQEEAKEEPEEQAQVSEQLQVADTKDYKSLIKDALDDNFNKYIKDEFKISNSDFDKVINPIVDTIIDKKLFKENTLDDFYNKLIDDKDYSIDLIKDSLKYLNGLDFKDINDKINKIREQAKDYESLIKDALEDNYNKYIKSEFKISDTEFNKVIDSIVDTIINKKIYKEQTLEQFYNKLVDDKDYSISLIKDSLKYLTGTDYKTISDKINKIQDQAKDYKGLIKKALQDNYNKYIKNEFKISDTEFNKVLDSMVDTIINKKLYKEKTLEEFYNKLVNDKDYSISLVKDSLKYLTSTDAKTINDKINKIHEQAKDAVKQIEEKAKSQTNSILSKIKNFKFW